METSSHEMQSSRTTSGSPGSSDEDDIIEITSHGDIVLQIRHEALNLTSSHRFRVSSTHLQSSSKYFARLLQGAFAESQQIEAKHQSLRQQYGSLDKTPVACEELPVIEIQDVGRISAVKSIAALCTDFLSILQGNDINPPPIANLANLAIVADRFDALETMKAYVRRKKFIWAIDGKMTPKLDSSPSEVRVRQRALVGILLEEPSWMAKYTVRMITKGWVGKDTRTDENAALWWDLPARVEEELAYRRERVLETIQSLIPYFLKLYCSRERQCELGYDSSAQCDSFQLGEMMRFFTRVGALQVQGKLSDTGEPFSPFEGDIYTLLDTLREIPEYQIDRNHSHCGIRIRLIPLLQTISERLEHCGICADCWTNHRAQHAWIGAKRPMIWAREGGDLQYRDCRDYHSHFRKFFTARERDWSA